MADAIQPLTIAAKKYLAAQYKDITRFREEVLALPLSGIEAILASDDLHVESEDALYDFVLEWAGRHYNNQEKRLEVLRMRLAPLIRFFYMTVSKLQEVVANEDLKDYKLVFDALFLKCSRPCRAFGPYVPRTYDYLDFQVLRLETPSTECHVYLSLLRKRCATLFPTGRLQSPLFSWCGQEFFLSAECEFDSGRSLHFFSIYLRTQGNSSVNLVMEYKLAVRSKPTLEYEDQYIGNYTFNVGDIDDDKVLYVCTWDSFMAEDSRFSQDDISHFRANFTIQQ